MSLPHSRQPDEFRNSELFKQLQDQRDGTAVRKWPEGRISGSDDGEIAFEISSDSDANIVKVDFGKPVEWVGMPPKTAIELAQLLIKHARAISKESIRIVMN